MTKLFLESDQLTENWFMDLPLNYSYLWLVLKLKCNKGGIVRLNKKYLSFMAKFNVDIDMLIKLFENKITVFEDKLFINEFFADQNGYNLNLQNDAIRGRLKNFFENDHFNEELLRKIGYSFFLIIDKSRIDLCNIQQFLTQYPKCPKDRNLIDDYFIFKDLYVNNNSLVSDSQSKPIGIPSSSNGRGNINSNIRGSNCRSDSTFSFTTLKEELVNYPLVKKIKYQLTESEFDKLFKLDSPKKVNTKRFLTALKEIEEQPESVIEYSVYKSLEAKLTLPF